MYSKKMAIGLCEQTGNCGSATNNLCEFLLVYEKCRTRYFYTVVGSGRSFKVHIGVVMGKMHNSVYFKELRNFSTTALI